MMKTERAPYLISLMLLCSLYGTSPAFSADGYEPDNIPSEARSIAVGGAPRQREFDTRTDEDWVRFWCAAGKDYSIRAENTGESDLVIELFSENGQQPLESKDGGMDGEDEILEYTCPSTGEGIHLARIRLYDGTTFTGNNGYQLTVYHPTAPEIIMVSGRVRDVNTQAFVPNIIVLSDSGEGYITEPDGFYELYLEPAQFCLRTKQRCLSPTTPYPSCVPICYDTIPQQTVQQDINLCSPPLTTGIEVLKLLCAAQTSPSLNDLCDVNGDSRLGLEEVIHLLRRIAEIE